MRGAHCQCRGGNGVFESLDRIAGRSKSLVRRRNWKRYFGEGVGWGTWIRTRTNGVRVRGSTVNLFPIAGMRGAYRASPEKMQTPIFDKDAW